MDRRLVTIAALFAAVLVACGGGQRLSMIITSEPSEALVYVNDFPRGITPIEVPYMWIGTYRIQLRHDGYEEVNDLTFIGKPWYNWIPFASFFLDTLPLPVHHEVHRHYDLIPEPPEEF